MYFIHILLPVADNEGEPFPDKVLQDIQSELVERIRRPDSPYSFSRHWDLET